MTPQPVVIYGRTFQLQRAPETGGGSMTPYRITDAAGRVVTEQPTRFLAVARAAQAVREGAR